MKQLGAEAGGQTSLPSWASRLASTTAVAALALIAAPGAKADVVETFHLSGNFGNISGPLVSFTGTINLDFSNDFAKETMKSITISVQGRPRLQPKRIPVRQPIGRGYQRVQQRWRYARVVVCGAPVGHVGWLQRGRNFFW